jgi:hypothetical protein
MEANGCVMTDTSTPPEPQKPPPELPEEKKGESRMWLYFIIGIAVLLLIALAGYWIG